MTTNLANRKDPLSTLNVILNCILFSCLGTLLLLLQWQPEESKLFIREFILPRWMILRTRLLRILRSRPIIYDITQDLRKSCPEIFIAYELEKNGTNSRLDESTCNFAISEKIKIAYERDGVIALRGLISSSLLSELDAASAFLIQREKDRLDLKGGEYSTGKQFLAKKMGVVFDFDERLSSFRHVTLSSIIPKVVAQLLEIQSNETVRLLRDVFLAKDDGQYICGWHVDDWGFWPSSAQDDGVNVWIAVDDMPIATGGGFALSVGSHKAEWRHEAYELIGATPTIPNEGFQSAEDMFKNRKGLGTCNMKTASPQMNNFIEESMRIYDIRKGDVIFHTRWLFHRTVAFDPDYIRKKQMEATVGPSSSDPLVYRRYTIRYAPGYSTLPKGYGTELSILWNRENAGRKLDDVSSKDAPWYPKCYPTADAHEINGMKDIAASKLPEAIERRKERYKEMKPFLHEIGRKQRELLRANARGFYQVVPHASSTIHNQNVAIGNEL